MLQKFFKNSKLVKTLKWASNKCQTFLWHPLHRTYNDQNDITKYERLIAHLQIPGSSCFIIYGLTSNISVRKRWETSLLILLWDCLMTIQCLKGRNALAIHFVGYWEHELLGYRCKYFLILYGTLILIMIIIMIIILLINIAVPGTFTCVKYWKSQ